MSEIGWRNPSANAFYAVACRGPNAFRIVFGPVYHEELAHHALDAMSPRDGAFGVHRREIRAQHAHYTLALSNERALLRIAVLDPLEFGAIVRQGVAHPIVIPIRIQTQLSLADRMLPLA